MISLGLFGVTWVTLLYINIFSVTHMQIIELIFMEICAQMLVEVIEKFR